LRPVVTRLAERLRVYGITPDTLDAPSAYEAAVRAAVEAGATTIQYRDKRSASVELRRQRAAAVGRACRAGGALFLVNDDVALAAWVGADGVHLGPSDASVAAVRAAHPAWVIGGSAGDVVRARALVQAGCDYLGVGAIFDARASKADASAPRGVSVLREICADAVSGRVAVVAIGGVTAETAGACISAGASGVASIRSVFGGESVSVTTARFARSVGQAVLGVSSGSSGW
jgi:thiamine-phosphate pyrophosphorylase